MGTHLWIVSRRARATGGRPEAGEATAGGGRGTQPDLTADNRKKNGPSIFSKNLVFYWWTHSYLISFILSPSKK